MKPNILLKQIAFLLVALTLGAGMASSQTNPILLQQAVLSRLGNQWAVTECCGWTGTWTRRGTSNTFDATWRHTNGTVVSDVLELSSWNAQTQEVVIKRASLNGQYKATYQAATNTLVNGTATWYPSGAKWSATISQVVAPDDVKGPVNIRRR